MPALAALPETPELILFALLTLLLGVCGWILVTLQQMLAQRADSKGSDDMSEHWEKVEEHLASIRDGQGQALDLRRIEHLLVDIRDGNKRLEERFVSAAERSDSPGPMGLPLSERLRARLLSEGYERIEILTPAEYHAGLLESGGEMLVEARRSGASYKGKVRIEDGLLVDVNLRPSHTIFP
ncbi:MAG: hypothetical protein P1V35_07010 [Planctomycetota bacterium]|nr:hypothetical protein [Planctomycetota bacterium]